MKKTLIAVSALAAFLLAVSVANAQFGSIKVPGMGDVKKHEYSECKSFCEKYRNNIDYNSTNIENLLNNNKDISIEKYSKDWRRGGSKYDKEHKVLELTANYKTMHKMTLRCNNEKCTTFYCSSK